MIVVSQASFATLVVAGCCALAACSARSQPAAPAAPSTPRPGLALLERADRALDGSPADKFACWNPPLICDIDGHDPVDRHLATPRSLPPGHHRIRIECASGCAGESSPLYSAGRAVVGPALSFLGIIGRAIDIAGSAGEAYMSSSGRGAVTLEFEAEPDRTYLLMPIVDAAPLAPWVEIVEQSEMKPVSTTPAIPATPATPAAQ